MAKVMMMTNCKLVGEIGTCSRERVGVVMSQYRIKICCALLLLDWIAVELQMRAIMLQLD